MIIEFFVIQTDRRYSPTMNSAAKPFFKAWSARQVLKLRLVCKNWSKAVTPISFRTIYLIRSDNLYTLLRDCKDLFRDPNISCPVKKLYIHNLVYGDLSLAEFEDGDFPHPQFLPALSQHYFPPDMDSVVELIDLLGQNLVELDLLFAHSMGFSPDMVESVKKIKSLKKLSIEEYGSIADERYINCGSLADILNATPDLESLKIRVPALDILELKPQALSKLRHFWFLYDADSIESICHICKTVKDSLKVIEHASGSDSTKWSIVSAIEPVKDTLEGLFTYNFRYDYPLSIINMTLPKLRVIRGSFFQDAGRSKVSLSCLQFPFLQTVRTLVTSLSQQQESWNEALSAIDKDCLRKPPNLKHVVFTMDWREMHVDESLVKAFEVHGLECHFVPKLNFEEILELDYKLNGPM